MGGEREREEGCCRCWESSASSSLLSMFLQDSDDMPAGEAEGIPADIVSDGAGSSRFKPVESEVTYVVSTVTTDIR